MSLASEDEDWTQLDKLTDQEIADFFEEERHNELNVCKAFPAYLVYRILVARAYKQSFEELAMPSSLTQMWGSQLADLEPLMTDAVEHAVNRYWPAFWAYFKDTKGSDESMWLPLIRVEGTKTTVYA